MTSMIINSVIKESHNILMRLIESSGFNIPANILIPWGVGRRLRPEPFRSKYGLKAACIAGSPLAKGIGIMLDMTVPKVAGATGYADTDTDAKAEAALKMCRGNDYVMLHVGGPDEASHDGDPASKVKIISKLDTMLGRILTELNLEDNLIILLADHTTSTALRRHTTHPTPIVMAGMHIVPDGVRKYDERSVAGGGLGKIHMKKVMSTVTEVVK
ncbi:MAG: phosphoglycerate mutase, partial [Candidatus Bathyarchaeia archaeon]